MLKFKKQQMTVLMLWIMKKSIKVSSHVKVQRSMFKKHQMTALMLWRHHPVIQADVPQSDNGVGWDAHVRLDSNIETKIARMKA